MLEHRRYRSQTRSAEELFRLELRGLVSTELVQGWSADHGTAVGCRRWRFRMYLHAVKQTHLYAASPKRSRRASSVSRSTKLPRTGRLECAQRLWVSVLAVACSQALGGVAPGLGPVLKATAFEPSAYPGLKLKCKILTTMPECDDQCRVPQPFSDKVLASCQDDLEIVAGCRLL